MTRVVTLSLSDVAATDGGLTISLGTEPVVLPEAVASLVSRYLADRVHTGGVNATTQWLFPGTRAGAHMIAMQLTQRLNRLGITKLERQGALTHLVGQVPVTGTR